MAQFHCNLLAGTEGVGLAEEEGDQFSQIATDKPGSSVQNQWLQKDFSLELNLQGCRLVHRHLRKTRRLT